MKKLLLSLGMMGLGFGAMSQVIFSVEEPASISGFYEFSSNGEGSSWGLANLNGVQVIDTIVIPNDGTPGVNAQGNPASATGCNALPAGSLAGKIAMVFRGDGGNPAIGACGFGVKVQMCENAGAVAVIIVNREEGSVAMSGGTEGAATSIPVVSVSLSTGLAIMNAITNGDDVIGFIGDKTGYYADDISIFDNGSLRAEFGAMPSALAQSAAELTMPLGAWVYNYGQNDQTGITVKTIINNGSNVYDQTSTAFDLLSGDSMYVSMPDFSMASYTAGNYDVSYTLGFGVTDEFDADNSSVSNFAISDSMWSLARLDPVDVLGKDGFYRASTLPTGEYQSCIVLNNPNASRLRTDGMYYGGITVGAADTLTVTFEGQEVGAAVFKWDDNFTDASDATFDALSAVAEGTAYTVAGQEEATLWIPFDNIYTFEDDQNYLVCVIDYVVEIYHAFDTKSIYDENAAQSNMPRFPIKTGTSSTNYNALGFGIAPSIALHVGTDLGIADNTTIESSAYPNPSTDVITVKVNAGGNATLNVTDMAGRVVSTQEVKIFNGQFTTNVAGMNAGTYVFTLDLENGTSSRFNVVVTK